RARCASEIAWRSPERVVLLVRDALGLGHLHRRSSGRRPRRVQGGEGQRPSEHLPLASHSLLGRPQLAPEPGACLPDSASLRMCGRMDCSSARIRARFERGEGVAIIALFEVEGATAAKYDEVIRRLTDMGLRVPDGQMYHICYGDRRRLQVIDVYESQAQLDAFAAKLMPILHEMQI